MRLKIMLLVLPVYFLSFTAQKSSELPEKYQKWMEEEVVYIITENEKEVFPKLETNRDRDLFIDEFWKERDPTPGTPRNEFREEHYRRIEYANKNLGKEGPGKGWRCDQGRFYITLGEPLYIDKFTNETECHPIELWYYQGNVKFGQAPVFRLLFFKRGGIGEFELYYPISDGPQVLTPLSSMRLERTEVPGKLRASRQWRNSIMDHKDVVAYETLMRVSHDLAQASFSNFPGREGPDQKMPSDILIGQARKYPQQKVKDDYAYDILEHKPVVEVSYSVNHIEHREQIKILQDHEGLFFVNYLIEPEVFSVDFYIDKYFTNLRTSVRVTDVNGKTVFQQMKQLPVEMKKKQLVNVLKRPFNLADSFPMIPGVYKFMFMMENLVTKEYLSFEKYVSVPETDTLRLGSLVFSNKVNRLPSSDELRKAFQVGNLQFYPSANNQFYKKDTLYLFFQMYGMDEALKDQGNIEYVLYKGDKQVHSLVREIRKYGKGGDFLQEFNVGKFYAGDYTVIVSVVDRNKNRILSTEENFFLLSKEPPEKWVVSQLSPPAEDPVYSYIIANQFLNKGEVRKAKTAFEKACRKRKKSLDFALGLAKTHLVLDENREAKSVLLPFHEKHVDHFSLNFYLGAASQNLEEYEEAVGYYQKALSQRGDVVAVLNSIGECHLVLDNQAQAVKAWEKSLEVNPNQEEVKQRLAVLKEEK